MTYPAKKIAAAHLQKKRGINSASTRKMTRPATELYATPSRGKRNNAATELRTTEKTANVQKMNKTELKNLAQKLTVALSN
jgi:hypothetical protein